MIKYQVEIYLSSYHFSALVPDLGVKFNISCKTFKLSCTKNYGKNSLSWLTLAEYQATAPLSIIVAEEMLIYILTSTQLHVYTLFCFLSIEKTNVYGHFSPPYTEQQSIKILIMKKIFTPCVNMRDKISRVKFVLITEPFDRK